MLKTGQIFPSAVNNKVTNECWWNPHLVGNSTLNSPGNTMTLLLRGWGNTQGLNQCFSKTGRVCAIINSTQLWMVRQQGELHLKVAMYFSLASHKTGWEGLGQELWRFRRRASRHQAFVHQVSSMVHNGPFTTITLARQAKPWRC